MKFTKTAVAVAIAGFAAAPMIAAADTTLSGAVQIQLNGTDADGDAADPTINADDVLFGITSEHELNSGLTGYGSLRVDMNRLSNEGRTTFDPGTPTVDEDDTEVTTLGSADSVYVGIKGGFGDVRFGEIPNAVEVGQVANDIFDVTGEVNGGISYSGSFGPVGIVANFSPENNSDMVGLGATFGIGGFKIGIGAEDKADTQAMAAGATFGFAGASIGAHFWTRENGDNTDTESISAQVGYGFGGVSATLTVSMQDDGNGTEDDAIRLDLGYALGGGMDISSRITAASDNQDATEDLTSWRIKLSKSF